MKSWDRKFMDLAKEVSTWSKDPSTQIGAVIVGPDHEIRSTGYNGFPRGVHDDSGRLEQRDTRLMFTSHAETNAILNAARVGVSTKGCTMYCYGLPPCANCAKAIIQAGISVLIVNSMEIPPRWSEECNAGLTMFKEAGVKIGTIVGG